MKLIALVQSHSDESLTAPKRAQVWPALVQHAEYTLRAGVVLTFDDYLHLSALERLAFVRAGDKLRAEGAQRLGAATSSLAGAAAVTAEFDDGEALEQLSLEAIHSQAVADVGS